MVLPESSLRELAELADLLAADDLQDALARVSRVTARVVPGCEHASVTLFRDGTPTTVGQSDGLAREVDELQYAESEGPCLDAVREGSVKRVPDLADEPRWPTYAPRAAAAGVRSSLAIPLAAHGTRVGALNLYSSRPSAFDKGSLALAELLAGHAALALHGAALYFASRGLADQLHEAMTSRAVIEQAKGMLMARHGVGPDRAFDLLRQASQTSNRKLRDVARDLVESVTAEQDADERTS